MLYSTIHGIQEHNYLDHQLISIKTRHINQVSFIRVNISEIYSVYIFMLSSQTYISSNVVLLILINTNQSRDGCLAAIFCLPSLSKVW